VTVSVSLPSTACVIESTRSTIPSPLTSSSVVLDRPLAAVVTTPRSCNAPLGAKSEVVVVRDPSAFKVVTSVWVRPSDPWPLLPAHWTTADRPSALVVVATCSLIDPAVVPA
jgi:hypothetical protein